MFQYSNHESKHTDHLFYQPAGFLKCTTRAFHHVISNTQVLLLQKVSRGISGLHSLRDNYGKKNYRIKQLVSFLFLITYTSHPTQTTSHNSGCKYYYSVEIHLVDSNSYLGYSDAGNNVVMAHSCFQAYSDAQVFSYMTHRSHFSDVYTPTWRCLFQCML